MASLAKCHMDILLDIHNNPNKFTLEQLRKRYNEADLKFLQKVDNKHIEFFTWDKTETTIGAQLTAKGKIAVDEYLNSLEDKDNENKRFKQTRLIAWIGVITGILGLAISIITLLKTL